ncbi:MAG TPA: LysM peptidoglycan-binding domain-containing protein [Jiangellaceae bacterium]
MTTVTIAPAAETDGRTGSWPGRETERPHAGMPVSARLVRSVAEVPFVTEARPRVRRVRGPNGTEKPRVRPRHRRGVTGPPRAVACERSFEPDIHGSRLTRRGRVVVGIIWLVFAAAIIFMVSRPAELPVPAETTTVTIRSGDTLWRVAGGVAPEADPRVTVDQIMELNGLQSASDLQPGDVLVVPVAGD